MKAFPSIIIFIYAYLLESDLILHLYLWFPCETCWLGSIMLRNSGLFLSSLHVQALCVLAVSCTFSALMSLWVDLLNLLPNVSYFVKTKKKNVSKYCTFVSYLLARIHCVIYILFHYHFHFLSTHSSECEIHLPFEWMHFFWFNCRWFWDFTSYKTVKYWIKIQEHLFIYCDFPKWPQSFCA